jgi:hypothetical protein
MIKQLPFIQGTIEKLIQHNTKQIEAVSVKPRKSRIPLPSRGGKHGLVMAAKPLTPVKGETRLVERWARTKESKRETPTFGKEPIEFEDDFISDDEDEGHKELLKLEVTVLRESTSRGRPASVPPRRETFPIMENSPSAEVDSLRGELEEELGTELLGELYRSLQNSGDPGCKQYVRRFERENRKAVMDVRSLIYLEAIC